MINFMIDCVGYIVSCLNLKFTKKAGALVGICFIIRALNFIALY